MYKYIQPRTSRPIAWRKTMIRIFAVDLHGNQTLVLSQAPASFLAEAKRIIADMGYAAIAEMITPRNAIRRHLMAYI